MSNLSSFGERLDELLFERKIKPEQLASAINVSLVTVYNWKSNAKNILLSHLIEVANYFNCSIDFLMGRSEEIGLVVPKECPQFSKRLREVMKEKGVSTYKLRQNTRYSSKYFQNWDKGSDPNALTIIELANILDCSIDYLVGRER